MHEKDKETSFETPTKKQFFVQSSLLDEKLLTGWYLKLSYLHNSELQL